jgi:hypothetical protein
MRRKQIFGSGGELALENPAELTMISAARGNPTSAIVLLSAIGVIEVCECRFPSNAQPAPPATRLVIIWLASG